FRQIGFRNHAEAFVGERLEAHFDVVDHQRDSRSTVGANQQRVGLNDVDLSLEQRRANLQQRLMPFRKFDADEIALNHRQPGALENLAALFGMTEQKTNEAAFRRIGDRQRDNPDSAAFESPHDFEKLPNAVFQK